MHVVHQTRPQVRRDRLLRLPEVEAASGLKKSTVYLLMKRGEFPHCVRVTPRCVAWPESAVLQWVQDRINAANLAPDALFGTDQATADHQPPAANGTTGAPQHQRPQAPPDIAPGVVHLAKGGA